MTRNSIRDAVATHGRTAGTALTAGLFLLLAATSGRAALSPFAAHDEAVLESPQSSVSAGSALQLEGRHFEAGESYTLRLLGALREYDLRKMEPDSAGTLSFQLDIPREVVPGGYQLVAVAADGDVVARLDIAVLAPSPVESSRTEGEAQAVGRAAQMPAARTDDIRIERNRGGVEWGVIGLVIGLAGGLGVGLLRRA